MRTSALACLFIALFCVTSVAQSPAPDGAYESLTKAFDALRLHNYDQAIAAFREAIAQSPRRADIHNNLAYTLLKTGDSEAAREEFGEAMRLDPADFHVALEYAFLCFEARDNAPARRAEARRIFALVRDTGDTASRATAAGVFRDIDEPLRAGIQRWQQALATSTPSFSAHYELAQLAEQRDETELAAASYRAAFRLQPNRKSVLLELARVEGTRGNAEGRMAALLAASRASEPRAAELAREQLPARYPYVYEFRQALELDPGNTSLHQELAYLLLRMSENGQAGREEAEKEFAVASGAAPDDDVALAQLGLLYLEDERSDLAMPLLNRVLAHGSQATANRVRMALHMPLLPEQRDIGHDTLDPRVLGERSYAAGFMKDALRYLTQARETNPDDAGIALKLGWANNLLHDDATAVRWFDIARKSAVPAIADEAQRAWKNLEADQRRIRTTVWLYPLLSSRWSDLFGYGQLKTELRLRSLPVHPYVSIRLAGDARRSTGGPLPQSLSESSFTTALGIATTQIRGANLWFEAGIATSYLNGVHWSDYRGGLSWAKTHGAFLNREQGGWFLETLDDNVYISHFDRDLINYVQLRAGYSGRVGGIHTQAFWSQNVTFDAKQQYWANFIETGPGLRFHPPGLPASVWISLSAVHGIYLRNEGNPGRPNFNDIRLGVWYAFTK